MGPQLDPELITDQTHHATAFCLESVDKQMHEESRGLREKQANFHRSRLARLA